MTDLAAAPLTEHQATTLLESGAIAVDKVLSRHLFDGRLLVRRNGALLLSLAPPLEDFAARRMELALRDADGVVRASALKAWVRAQLSPDVAMRACVAGLGDVKEEVQEIAVEGALTLLERGGGLGADQLIGATADSRPYVRFAAVDVLRRAGARVLDALIEGLLHPQGVARRYVRQLLRQLGAPAGAALVALLEDDRCQAEAAKVLTDLDVLSPQLRPAVKAMRAKGPMIRALADQILQDWSKAEEKRLNQPAPVALPAYYERALSDDEAAQACGGLTSLQLLFNLRDGREVVRANTLVMLRLMELQAADIERVLGGMVPMLRDEVPVVRVEAAKAYAHHKGALGPLVAAGQDKDETVRSCVHTLLTATARVDMPGLLSTLAEGQSRHYNVVIDALLSAGKDVLAQLEQAIKTGASPMVREVCARVLGSTGKPTTSALTALLGALQDEHDAVRFRAVWALDKLDATDDKVIRTLMRLEMSETARHVKRAAYKGVKRLSALAQERRRAAEPEPSPELATVEMTSEIAVVEVSKLAPKQAVRLLGDGRAKVRANVARGITAAIDTDAGQALLRGLKDASPEVRQASALSIARNRMDPQVAIPGLLDALVRAAPPVDEVLVQAVASYGEDAHGPLMATLAERSYRVARTTGRVAPAFDHILAKRLGDCLKHDRTTAVRRNAADVLGMMGASAGESAVSDLLAGLQDPTPSLRLQIIGSLAQIAPPSEEVRVALRNILTLERRASIHRAIDRALQVIEAR